jgi:hypothetical protein
MADPEVVPELNLIPDPKLVQIAQNMVRLIEWANEHSHDDGTV